MCDQTIEVNREGMCSDGHFAVIRFHVFYIFTLSTRVLLRLRYSQGRVSHVFRSKELRHKKEGIGHVK